MKDILTYKVACAALWWTINTQYNDPNITNNENLFILLAEEK